MKKRIVMTGVLLLSIIAGLWACDGEEKLPPPPKPPVTNNAKMFGMCAVPRIDNLGSADVGVTPEMIATLCKEMNVKAFRLWMHIAWVMELDQATGEPVFKNDVLQKFKTYVALLKEVGVEDILLFNHSGLYPKGFTASAHSVVPLPDSEDYMRYMELFEKCYKMIATEFPDVRLFEPGNETSAHGGQYLAKPGYIWGSTAEQNEPYLYTLDEMALITTDLCYYAHRGVASVNPANEIVFPGVIMNEFDKPVEFMNRCYEHIESGKLPTSRDFTTGQRKLPADTEPDNYFDYLNWHPYVQAKYTTAWLETSRSMYQAAVDHDDADKKVLLTEFGFYDSFSEARQEAIPEYCISAIQALERNLPTLQSVFIFRMFNWVLAGADVAAMEKTFGIFSSPEESQGAVPKPIALSLFFYFNGKTADPEPLYQFAK